MPYSELANSDVSLDLQRQRDRDSHKGESAADAAFVIPQWQIDDFVAAEDCAGEERLAGDNEKCGVEMEVVNGGEWDRVRGNGHNAFVRDANTSTSEESDMESLTRVHVRRKARRRRGEQRVLPEIVITPSEHRPTATATHTSRDDSTLVERDAAIPRYDEAGPSNAVRNRSGVQQRTYAGSRRIKGAPASSTLTDVSSNSFGESRFGHRESAFTHSFGAYIDERSGVDDDCGLFLPEGSSRGASSRGRIATHGTLGGSSRPYPIGEPSRSPGITPLDHKRHYSRNSVYDSPSKIINGARRYSALPRKSGRAQALASPSDIVYSDSNAKRQKPSICSSPRKVFDCVLIPPPELPFPRESYRPMNYYISREIKRRAGKNRSKGKDREHARSESIIVETGIEGQGLKRGPPKQKQKEKGKRHEEEVICISSDNETPVSSPSKSTLTRHLDSTSDAIRQRSKESQVISISSSSEDEDVPSDRDSPRKPPVKESIVISPKPMLTAKRVSKRPKREAVLSSDESSTESVSEMVVTRRTSKPSSARPSRSQPGSLSSGSLRTPPVYSGQYGTERRTGIDVDKKDVEIDPDQEDSGAEGPEMEDEKTEDVVSSSPSGSPLAPCRKDSMGKCTSPSGSAGVVVSVKPSPPPCHNHSTKVKSSTVSPSSSLTGLKPPSPSSRSTTLAAEEEPMRGYASDSSGKMKMKSKLMKPGSIGANVTKNLVEDHKNEDTREVRKEDAEVQDDSGNETDTESESSSDEPDDVCHRCRSRNIYAKMKCTNIKKRGVCPLHYCHRCIVVFFPKTEFDPYSTAFICPSCRETCNCIGCNKKRGETERPAQPTRRWNELGVDLLLSHQETRRRERAEMRRAAGLPEQSSKRKSSKTSKRSQNTEADVNRVVNIGEEAEDWLRRQRAGNRKIRAFVGMWQDSWGPTPFCVHEMDGVHFDIHAVSGSGKGKERAIDPDVRLFVGNERGLYRLFLRAEEITIRVPVHQSSPLPPEECPLGGTQKKRPGRKRKQTVVGDTIYVKPERKKQRLENSITIPGAEHAVNQDQGQEDGVSSSSATSPFFHPTPDDYSPFQGLPGSSSAARSNAYGYPYGHLGLPDDAALGGINGPFESFGGSGDVYGYEPDWDSIGVGLDTSKKGTEQVTDFSYQGTYDSYAAAVEEGFGLVHPGKDLMPLIDPTLIDSGTVSKPYQPNSSTGSGSNDRMSDPLPSLTPDHIPDHNPDSTPLSELDSNTDPSRYLTPYANVESTLMSVPMIYGVPSSTGLSLQELQRTVKESLSILSSPVL